MTGLTNIEGGAAAVSVEIHGAEQLAALSKALRDAGEKDLQRELGKAINRAVKPLKEAAKASARQTLPHRGGLAAKVARGKFTTQRRANARTAGVRVVASNLSVSSLRSLDRGILRHPVYGNREEWVNQRVPAGWWTRPTEDAAGRVRVELLAAMDDIARKIGRRL